MKKPIETLQQICTPWAGKGFKNYIFGIFPILLTRFHLAICQYEPKFLLKKTFSIQSWKDQARKQSQSIINNIDNPPISWFRLLRRWLNPSFHVIHFLVINQTINPIQRLQLHRPYFQRSRPLFWFLHEFMSFNYIRLRPRPTTCS